MSKCVYRCLRERREHGLANRRLAISRNASRASVSRRTKTTGDRATAGGSTVAIWGASGANPCERFSTGASQWRHGQGEGTGPTARTREPNCSGTVLNVTGRLHWSMSAIHGQERSADRASLGALAHPRRRWIVDTLRDDGALEVGELATRATAWENDSTTDAVDRDDQQRTMVELIHVDLPVLADAELVEYDPAARVVSPADDEGEDVVDVETDLPPEVLDALAHTRRRETLALLSERVTPVSVADLAWDLASVELDAPTSEVPASYRHAVHVALHHCHLPKLDDVDLVMYDRTAQEVERSSQWLERVDELLSSGDGGHTAGGHDHRRRSR